MHKLLVLYSHPSDPEHFRRYYVDTHLPMVRQLPGLLASRHSFSVQGAGVPAPYFCVWEGEFASAEAMAAAMASPIGRQVGADTANYATGGVAILHFEPHSG